MMRYDSVLRSSVAGCSCLAVCTILLLARAVVCQENQILITKADGSQLRVPTTGPLADSNAESVAKSVHFLDADLKAAKKGHNPRGTGTTGDDAQVRAAMWQIALESRNEAVDQLDLAYRVAEQTSAGNVDLKLVDKAKQGVERAREVMTSPAPPSLFVHTEIQVGKPNATLHYIDMASYKRQSTAWVSYDFGVPLHIGLYMFRLDAPDVSEPYREEVLVLAEPTRHTITPLPR
jgi:hypothetical protein